MSEESLIGKFFGVLGLKVDHHGVEEFQKSLDHVKHAVEGIFMVEVGERIVEFVERSIGAAAAVNDLGEMTEMSARKIDALGRVAIENSSNVEAMQQAILGVYRATGQAAMGLGRNVKLFQTLGIHAKDSSGHVKSAEVVMEELAEKFHGMDMAKVIGTAGRLGIDPMIAKAMKEMGAEGWRREMGEAMKKGLLSEADYQQADKTEKTFKRFHLVIGQISTLLANQLAPWLRRAVDALERFIVENKVEFIKRIHAAMKTLSGVLSTVWDWGSRLWDVMGKFLRRMEASRFAGETFRLVLVAIAAVKTAEIIEKVAAAVNNLWVALTKIPKLVAGIGLVAVAVGLLVEDWIGFKNGEESVIGDLEKRWPAAFKVISTAMEGLLKIWDDIVEAARSLGIIEKKAAPKMSLARYAEYVKNGAPVGTPEADEFAEMDRLIKRGGHPMAMFAQNVDRARDISGAMAASIADKTGAVNRTATGIGTVLADQEARQGNGVINTYITGTRVTVQADTDEHARMAGKSVRESLDSQRVRNYQPRSF